MPRYFIVKDENVIDLINGQMKAQRITYSKMADELGVTYVTVSRWLNKINTPNYIMLNQMLDIVGLRMIIGRKERKNKNE